MNIDLTRMIGLAEVFEFYNGVHRWSVISKSPNAANRSQVCNKLKEPALAAEGAAARWTPSTRLPGGGRFW